MFIARALPGNQNQKIREAGFFLHILPAPALAGSANEIAEGYASWSGVPWRQDADETRLAVKNQKVTWIIVDHYALDSRWEKVVADDGIQIAVIDDLADRPHDCKILIDQNVGRQAWHYDGLVPRGAKCLVGPEFALLRPEFAEIHEPAMADRVKRHGQVNNILISMGGIDAPNATGAVLECLATLLPRQTTPCIHVIMGSNAPALASVKRQVQLMPVPCHVVVDVSNMAKRMAAADIGIGGAGVTSLERCCVGLPSIIIVLAENQVRAANFMHENGLAWTIGNADAHTINRCFPEVWDMAKNTSALQNMASACHAIADGLGRERVCAEF
jgi:UDP-2,4-diacetamido-2,4,6-trideoxy-beta-L-altropyranose hydrolase